MRNLLTLTLMVILAWSTSTKKIWAQESEPILYYVVDYMKVAPGMADEYLKLEAIWKKLHAARIKSGKLDGWMLQRIASPSGKNVEYNYVTVNHYVGNKKLAAHFETTTFSEDLRSALTDEEWKMVEKTGQFRDLVKSEVWRARGETFAENMEDAKLHVFNFFKLQPGFRGRDHGKIENEIWKPVHAARIAAGKMKGWGMYSKELPYGSQSDYNDATIDFYTNMEQFLMPWGEDFFAKVHPGQNQSEAFAKTTKIADLIRAEVRMTIDQIGF